MADNEQSTVISNNNNNITHLYIRIMFVYSEQFMNNEVSNTKQPREQCALALNNVLLPQSWILQFSS